MSIPDDARQTRETSFGWMIQRIASGLNGEMEAALAAHDLSLPQFAVMMTVLEHGPMTQAEIGARFSMPAYAISRAIDHLEKEGLLQRRPHPTSRRSLLITPTPEGDTLAPDLFAIVRSVNGALTENLTDTERQQLADLLPKLLVTLNEMQA